MLDKCTEQNRTDVERRFEKNCYVSTGTAANVKVTSERQRVLTTDVNDVE